MSDARTLHVESLPPDADGWGRVCAVAGPDAPTPRALEQERPDEILVAVRHGADVARVALWWRATPPLARERTGLLGRYAAGGARTGASLLEAACARLRERGATLALGPMDGSTWCRYRLVTWRAPDPPFLLEPDNPRRWPAHFAAARFAPFACYRSTRCDDLRLQPIDAALESRLTAEGFRCRALDPAKIDEELSTLWRLSCDAFAHNVLYTPLDEAVFRGLYAPLVAAMPPQLVTIAEHRGDPVAFVFTYPDALQATRGEPVDTVVIKTLGVVDAYKRRGLGRWLYERTVAAARAAGFRSAIHALMHDENPSRRLGAGHLRLIRRYALYARPL